MEAGAQEPNMSAVLAYKNFAAHRNISHIGLGVAAINTLKCFVVKES